MVLNFYKQQQNKLSDPFTAVLNATAPEFGGLNITSGYRSPAYNRTIGGAKRSRHMHGDAADIDMSGMDDATRTRLVQRLRANGATGFITYDRSPDMLHVDLRPGQPHYMHNKSSKYMDKAPEWFKAVASDSGGAATVNAQFNPEQGGAMPMDNDFDPLAAGAIPLDDDFDPSAVGAMPLDDLASPEIAPVEAPPAPAPMVNQFEAQIAGMDETDLSIARAKNTPLGEYLRGQAGQSVAGESEEQRQQRLYGSLPDSNATPLETARTFTRGVVEGVPIAGPALLKGVESTAAGIDAAISDRTYAESKRKAGEIRRMDKVRSPTADVAGQFTGAVAPMLGLGATALGARALGITGKNVLTRAAASGLSGGGIAGADTLARGGGIKDAAQSAGIGGGIGAAVPFVGAALGAGGRLVKDVVGPRINALVRPEYESARRLGTAIDIDRQGAGLTLEAGDEAAARAGGQQLLNVDRGGELTRALARSAANVDPDARALIERTASDRFAGQYGRAADFINRIVGGRVDDVAFQENVRQAARLANKPAYDRAFDAAPAQSMWDDGFEELMQAPAMQQAARDAAKRGANRAVIEGFEPIKNPFRDVDGRLTVKELIKPSLRFWNQAKIELDNMIGTARAKGERAYAGDLGELKKALVTKLDDAVPEYATARAGAAGFFDAEDAIEAGRKFVGQNKDIRQAAKAIKGMTKDERKGFQVGFTGELLEKLGNVRDRANVIDRLFGNPNARAKIELALGKKRTRELNQFVRIETIMDFLRGAMGNSTTGRQLREMGLATGMGAGAGFYTGDISTGIMVAAATRGARFMGARVDEGITKRIAKLLVSDDPQEIQRAITLATNNPKVAKAVEFIQRGIGLGIRGGVGYELQPEQ